LIGGSGIEVSTSGNTIRFDNELSDDFALLRDDFDNASGVWIKDGTNVGLGDGEVFSQKSGSDLEFRRILGSSGIVVSTSGNTVIVNNTLEDDFILLRDDFDNSSGVFVKDGENIGGAVGVFSQKDVDQNLEFFSLLGGSGIEVTSSGNIIRFDSEIDDDFVLLQLDVTQLRTDFDNASGVWVKDGENLGAGSGVFVQKDTDENLEFRTITAGDGIGINQTATELEVFSTVLAEATTASNVGIGSGEVFAQKVGNDLQFRRLLGGSGIQTSTSGNTVRIDNTLEDDFGLLQTDVTQLRTDFDNSSGVWVEDGENLGGANEIFVQKDVDMNLEFRTLIGGSGIEVSTSGNTIRFDNELSDDFVLLRDDFDNSSGVFLKNLENIGGANEIFAQKDVDQNAEIRTLLGGSGIEITTSGNVIRFDSEIDDDFALLQTDVTELRTDFDNASGVWVKDGENLGAGSGVFVQKDTDENLEFRTIVAGDGVGINQSATELEIFSTVLAEATTASNVGIGSGEVFAQKVGNDLQFRRLLGGSGIQTSTSGNTVRIDNTLEDDFNILRTDVDQLQTDFDNSSGVFVKNAENLGGAVETFIQKDTDQNLEFRTLIGGSGIEVSASGDTIRFDNELSDDFVLLRDDFDNASGIWVKDGENLGGANEVFIQKDADENLEFRTLIGGSGIEVTTSGNTIRFDSELVDDVANLNAVSGGHSLQAAYDGGNTMVITDGRPMIVENNAGTDILVIDRTDPDGSTSHVKVRAALTTISGVITQLTQDPTLHLITPSGDTILEIEADPTNSIESYNPRVKLTQDGGGIDALMGLEGNAGVTFGGSQRNSMYLWAQGDDTTGGFHIVVGPPGKEIERIRLVHPSGEAIINSDTTVSGNLIVTGSGNFATGLSAAGLNYPQGPGAANQLLAADGGGNVIFSDVGIDFTNSSGIFVKDGENLGGAVEVFVQKDTDENLEFRTLIGGSGIEVTASGNTIRFDNELSDDFDLLRNDFDNSSGVFLKNLENLGGAVDIFAQKDVDQNAEIRTLLGGSGIEVTASGDIIRFDSEIADDFVLLQTDVTDLRTDFDNASGIWVKDGENLGTGSGVFVQKDTDENLEFRTIIAGDGIGINQTATELEIFSTVVGAGEINTASNVGIGDGEVFAQKNGVDLEFRRLLSGSGIVVSTSGDTIRIDNTLEDDFNLLRTDFDNSSGIFVKDGENVGGAVEVFVQKDVDQNLEFRTLIGGSGIEVTASGNTIRFDNELSDDFSLLRGDFDNSSGLFYRKDEDLIPSQGQTFDVGSRGELFSEINALSGFFRNGLHVGSGVATSGLAFLRVDNEAIINKATINQISHPFQNEPSGVSTMTAEMDQRAMFRLVLGQNYTFKFNNPQDGGKYTFVLKQDAVAGRTVDWPNNVLWRGSSPPPLGASGNAVDVVTMIYEPTDDVFYADFGNSFGGVG
jgi:hypothetical protein